MKHSINSLRNQVNSDVFRLPLYLLLWTALSLAFAQNAVGQGDEMPLPVQSRVGVEQLALEASTPSGHHPGEPCASHAGHPHPCTGHTGHPCTGHTGHPCHP